MKQMTGTRAGIMIAPIVATVLSALYLMNVQFLEVLEEKTLDMRFSLRGKIAPGPEAVIAAIDEKSTNKLGRFPWPRSVWGRVVEKVVGFHILRFCKEYIEYDDFGPLFGKPVRRSGPRRESTPLTSGSVTTSI